MKKNYIIKLMTALCISSMLFTLTACGKDEANTAAEVVEEVEEVAEEEPEEVVEEPEIEEPEEVEEEVEEELSLEEIVEMVTGSYNGSKYENEYFGIGIELDSEWNLRSPEEIEEQRATALEISNSSELIEQSFEGAITDFLAINQNGYDTINFGIDMADCTDYSEQEYAEASIEPTKSALSEMGLEDVDAEVTSYDFDGTAHSAIKIKANYNGVPVYEFLFAVKNDKYISNITTCTWHEDHTEELADLFYSLQ